LVQREAKNIEAEIEVVEFDLAQQRTNSENLLIDRLKEREHLAVLQKQNLIEDYVHEQNA
jgi:hypothetical protein